MKSIKEKIFEAFETEHRTILSCIRSHLAKVEGTGAILSAADLDETLRMAHTLKGAARVVDLHSVVDIAHRMETVFVKVREGKITLSEEAIRTSHAALDAIEDLVAACKSNPPDLSVEIRVPAILERLEAVLGPVPVGTPANPAAPEIKPITIPPEIEAVTLATTRPEISTPSTNSTTSTTNPTSQHFTINSKQFENLIADASELLFSIQDNERLGKNIKLLEVELAQMTKSLKTQMLSQGQVPEPFHEALKTQLSTLLRKTQKMGRQAHQQSWLQGQMGRQLQKSLQSARIVPADTVLEGLHKMVRDLALKEGKKIEFRAVGLEIEADRLVLQALRPPLMHMLRNSVFHGIETPEQRKLAGKNEFGRIGVNLTVHGGQLKLELSDDGQGIDEVSVRELAMQQEIMTEAELNKKTHDELLSLIFLPGFSTADGVTETSGRGMGLSVVYEFIKRLQGTLQVKSTPGKGVSFQMAIPLKAAHQEVLVVRAQDQNFAIPLSQISLLKRIKVKELQQIEGRSSILHQDKPVPVLELATLLGQQGAHTFAQDQIIPLVLIELKDQKIALAVDGLVEKMVCNVRELGPPLNQQPHLLGSCLLSDGSMLFVLDVHQLLQHEQHASPVFFDLEKIAKTTLTKTPLRKKNKVLVVDDSITTRMLEKGILEASGFQVDLAVNGLEALSKLQMQTYDVMISDLEMPEMDGFGLLTEIKKSGRWPDLPIIMVSSRESPEDHEWCLKMGADIYIMKQRFNQSFLLQTIRGLLESKTSAKLAPVSNKETQGV